MAYSINQLAMITGLTTRTLRNHLSMGILKGDKVEGNWSFTEDALDEYIQNPVILKTIKAKQHAVIYDFLADDFKQENRICTILDFPVSTEEALDIARFFSAQITDHGRDIEFRYINGKHCARFILSGAETQVHDLMKSYYER